MESGGDGRFQRFALPKQGGPLGVGGQGHVWATVDALTGRPAVVKRVDHPTPAARARFRREVAALRGLAHPGVVRLLDADEEDDHLWLAMERVDGSAFPAEIPPRWSALLPVVEATLGALAAVHRAGLVHGDLKPGNLLVTPRGAPVLVDFGLVAVLGERAEGGGTPRYRAPEQADAEEVDGRADLYALGRMILEVLEGDAPSAVLDGLASFVAPDPDDRPASAGDALARLGLGTEAGLAALVAVLPSDPAPEPALQQLFTGHERILHLPGDAARALWRRTGGDHARVTKMLANWLRDGLAVWTGGRLSVPRPALEALEGGAWPAGEATLPGLGEEARLLPWIRLLGRHAEPARLAALLREVDVAGLLARLEAARAILLDEGVAWVLGWPPGFRARLLPLPRAEAARRVAALVPVGERLDLLLEAGASPSEIAAEAEAEAERALHEGRPAAAIRAVERGLPGARSVGRDRLVRLQARAALSLFTPIELDRALFAVDRAEAGCSFERELLRAARRSADGDGEGALRVLDRLDGESAPEELEIWRAAVRVHAAQRCRPSRLPAVLAELEEWAKKEPSRRAALAGWAGALAYRQERYAEAAALHEEAARDKLTLSGQRSAWCNAAHAWLELGDLDRATALASQALVSAEAGRHTRQTLDAALILRAAHLRAPDAERTEAPDLELVDIAFSVGRPAHGAVTGLAEAALAFRRGEGELTRTLALRAEAGFVQERMEGPALLCRGLALAVAPDPEAALEVIAAAERVEPGLGVQAAALAGWHASFWPASGVVEAARVVVARRSPAVTVPPHTRQEVLTVAEALARYGVDPGTPIAMTEVPDTPGSPS